MTITEDEAALLLELMESASVLQANVVRQVKFSEWTNLMDIHRNVHLALENLRNIRQRLAEYVLPKPLTLLKQLEWTGTGEDLFCCLFCEGCRPYHEPGCALESVLAEVEGKLEHA